MVSLKAALLLLGLTACGISAAPADIQSMNNAAPVGNNPAQPPQQQQQSQQQTVDGIINDKPAPEAPPLASPPQVPSNSDKNNNNMNKTDPAPVINDRPGNSNLPSHGDAPSADTLPAGISAGKPAAAADTPQQMNNRPSSSDPSASQVINDKPSLDQPPKDRQLPQFLSSGNASQPGAQNKIEQGSAQQPPSPPQQQQPPPQGSAPASDGSSGQAHTEAMHLARRKRQAGIPPSCCSKDPCDPCATTPCIACPMCQ